jgi:hypothetical protein
MPAACGGPVRITVAWASVRNVTRVGESGGASPRSFLELRWQVHAHTRPSALS